MLGRSFGTILLAIWLIAVGMIALFSLHFASMEIIMGIIALLAGILILIGR